MENNNLKIRGFGFGVFVVSSVTLFLWFMFVMCLKEAFQKGHITNDFKFLLLLIMFFVLCVYVLIISVKYLTCNFIEINEDELRISVSDYENYKRRWPKYNKINIKINAIDSVHLISSGILRPPVLIIKRKDGKPYHINTKPFARKSFLKLLDEFAKRNIQVEIEAGTI